MSSARLPPPLVYLYEHNSTGYCTNARNGMDLFEQKLPALFASGFLPRLTLLRQRSSITRLASWTPSSERVRYLSSND